jgi:hypothetical protein
MKTPKTTKLIKAEALRLVAELRQRAEDGDEAAVEAVFDIGNHAAETLEWLWPRPELDAVAATKHFIPLRHTNLPEALAPTGRWRADVLRRDIELAPAPPAPTKRDTLRDLASMFVACVHGEHEDLIGLGFFTGPVPVKRSVASSLKQSRDLGKWSAAFVEWLVTTWPESIIKPNTETGRGGLMLAIAEERARTLGTDCKDPAAILRQISREIFRPLVK